MAAPLDTKNVQGDIVHGLAKLTETFIFFNILDVNGFRKHLAQLIPSITSADKAKEERRKNKEHKHGGHGIRQSVGVNIAFSTWAMQKLKLSGINDPLFEKGMLADAKDLGEQNDPKDPSMPNWIPEFKQNIDGILLIAGDSKWTLNRKINEIKEIFHVDHKDATIKIVHRIEGATRPKDQEKHEHFGFADGISQPGIKDVGMELLPGQDAPGLNQGIFFLGRDGDVVVDTPNRIPRPDWALDGSFLVFRQLPQLVPEFDEFLIKNALPEEGLIPGVSGAELLGARLVGRWKSGAPVDVTDRIDNPEFGKDPLRNNVFEYEDDSQARCPWAAHTRKMYPREGSRIDESTLDQHRIMRRGIPYGPEVTREERESGKTTKDRGLVFVCYQSNLSQGFGFLQKLWANNPNFPFPPKSKPGFDPIIGQTSDDSVRDLSGVNPFNTEQRLNLNSTEFVGSNGGEYFFSPSISSLKKNFASASGARSEL